jgi:hypothetical protein
MEVFKMKMIHLFLCAAIVCPTMLSAKTMPAISEKMFISCPSYNPPVVFVGRIVQPIPGWMAAGFTLQGDWRQAVANPGSRSCVYGANGGTVVFGSLNINGPHNCTAVNNGTQVGFDCPSPVK